MFPNANSIRTGRNYHFDRSRNFRIPVKKYHLPPVALRTLLERNSSLFRIILEQRWDPTLNTLIDRECFALSLSLPIFSLFNLSYSPMLLNLVSSPSPYGISRFRNSLWKRDPRRSQSVLISALQRERERGNESKWGKA